MGFGPDKPAEALYKPTGVLIAVDSIEYVEATSTGCVIHLDSGNRIYTTKSWDALTRMVQGASRYNQEFVVVYQKKPTPIRKVGRADKFQKTLK